MLEYLSSNPEKSKGRLHKESKNQIYRSLFQRDRDRIIHSTAFRKLKQKTQVFIESESDYYRTRLTHTLEVSQISRTLCRALGLNEDLGECIALAHDLGHPPFGHNGEKILNEKMKKYGGFNHNEQTLRIVTELEKTYLEFNGLNLSWDSLEGLVKHNGRFIKNIPILINDYNKKHNLYLYTNPSLEGQIASISDDIAYNNHDIDDAIRANLINIEELSEIIYFREIISKIRKEHKNINKSLLISEIIRTSINIMVEDVIKTTKYKIETNSIKNLKDVRSQPNFLVSMSNKLLEDSYKIRDFLYSNVYNNSNFSSKRKKSENIINKLFDYYVENFSLLPEDWKNKTEYQIKQRIVCDYIAGMTDRYATIQYKLLNE